MLKKIFCFVVAALTVVHPAFFGSAKEPSVVRIGLIAELTGDLPAVGASCRKAAELAVNEVNKSGGLEVGGERCLIELSVEDNGGKADQSALAAQKLVTMNNVLALVGPNASRYAIPASEIAETAKVPMITPWATSPKATLNARTGKPKRYVFRACFIDSFQGAVMARFVRENLKFSNAAVLYDVASEYNKGIAEFFKQTFEKLGGKVVAFETYTTGDRDFSAQLTKIRQAAPDVVFLPNYYSEVPLQVSQARRLGLNVPFVGSDSWGSEELLKLSGGECEGFYFSTHYASDMATPAARRFIDAYKAAYGATPDDVAALTYDALNLVFRALERAGKTDDREALRAALAATTDFEGVTGKMRFGENSGDPVKSAVILKIKDGRFVWHMNAEA